MHTGCHGRRADLGLCADPLLCGGLQAVCGGLVPADYEKTGKANNENVLGKFVWIAIALLLAAAYGLPAVGIVIPWQVIAAVMVLALVLGLISIRKIYRFENYRDVYRQIIGDWNIRLDTSKSVVRESNRKLISMDASISSNRKGFEYLKRPVREAPPEDPLESRKTAGGGLSGALWSRCGGKPDLSCVCRWEQRTAAE